MKNINIDSSSRDTQQGGTGWHVSRRCFLLNSGILIAGYAFGAKHGYANGLNETRARFGIVTDIHYADAPANGTRHYRESLAKMRECVELMNGQNVDFLIELGDFKDQNSVGDETSSLQHLGAIESVFQQFNGKRYHVLGNHDVDSISKRQFSSLVQNSGIEQQRHYYSFDSNGLHFNVLDANYRANGADYDHGNFDWTDANVPYSQLEWLEQDLASTSFPSIVFVHQQMDGDDDYCVRNAAPVRHVLQERNKVLTVFQGHKHSGDYSCIENIHYYTLRAMVEESGAENNSYAIVDVHKNNDIYVTGYHKAVDKKLPTV